MSFIAMRHRHWNARTPGGASRLKDRLKRLREVLRRPLFEFLEQRLAPAVTFVFNTTYDNVASGGSGFFTNHPLAMSVLNQAGAILGSQLQNTLQAINPSGQNTWMASFNNPSSPSTIQLVNNQAIAANTIEVYVGAAPLGSGSAEHALASVNGSSSSGTAAWNSTVALRGQPSTGYGPWGGSISFDSGTNWSFAGTGGSPSSNQVDFLTVALHELGDVLGYGTAPSWNSDVNSATTPPTFVGPHAEAVYGAPAPLDATLSNWAEGTTSGGSTVTMDPSIGPGVRRTFTSLDWAGLADIGWHVDQLAVTPSGAPPSSVTVGTSFGLSVTAEDPDGLLDTTFGTAARR